MLLFPQKYQKILLLNFFSLTILQTNVLQHKESLSKVKCFHFRVDSVVSKFHLVDLAGSERQKKTKAEGDRLKEGKLSVIFLRILLGLKLSVPQLCDSPCEMKHTTSDLCVLCIRKCLIGDFFISDGICFLLRHQHQSWPFVIG